VEAAVAPLLARLLDHPGREVDAVDHRNLRRRQRVAHEPSAATEIQRRRKGVGMQRDHGVGDDPRDAVLQRLDQVFLEGVCIAVEHGAHIVRLHRTAAAIEPVQHVGRQLVVGIDRLGPAEACGGFVASPERNLRRTEAGAVPCLRRIERGRPCKAFDRRGPVAP
jgi:hypothetical protein